MKKPDFDEKNIPSVDDESRETISGARADHPKARCLKNPATAKMIQGIVWNALDLRDFCWREEVETFQKSWEEHLKELKEEHKAQLERIFRITRDACMDVMNENISLETQRQLRLELIGDIYLSVKFKEASC